MALDDDEKKQCRKFIHEMNNRLNQIALQSELAILNMKKGEIDEAEESLNWVLESCRNSHQGVRDFYDRLELTPEEGAI